MAGPLSINGVDVSSLGFRLAVAPGWLDAPSRTTPSAPRPLRAGAYPVGPLQETTRKLTLQGVVDATTADLARAGLDAVKSRILSAQPATIILPDSPTRFVLAYLDGFTSDPGVGPSMIQRFVRGRFDFSLLDPYAYDVTAQAITLNSSVNRAPLGTAPSYPVITISGAATNPVLSLYRFDGVLLTSMTITITDIGGDSLVVDMDRKTIVKNGATQIAALSAGDFFAMDPASAQNGVGTTAADQPYVTVSSGAGTTVYRRAWR